jgi:imidazoleglycerol-phosphate dehydratase
MKEGREKVMVQKEKQDLLRRRADGKPPAGDKRTAVASRQTRETEIDLALTLDGAGACEVSTGIGFFDHMLTALTVHSGMDLKLAAKGDLAVDGHHTVEDCGIVLGLALKEALGARTGINRFGSALLPMDDALARVAVDLSGRPYLYFDAAFADSRIGAFDTCLVKEFFYALAMQAGLTLHISLLYGGNDHHGCEAIFKAFARALREAAALGGGEGVPSTKGVLA